MCTVCFSFLFEEKWFECKKGKGTKVFEICMLATWRNARHETKSIVWHILYTAPRARAAVLPILAVPPMWMWMWCEWARSSSSLAGWFPALYQSAMALMASPPNPPTFPFSRLSFQVSSSQRANFVPPPLTFSNTHLFKVTFPTKIFQLPGFKSSGSVSFSRLNDQIEEKSLVASETSSNCRDSELQVHTRWFLLCYVNLWIRCSPRLFSLSVDVRFWC